MTTFILEHSDEQPDEQPRGLLHCRRCFLEPFVPTAILVITDTPILQLSPFSIRHVYLASVRCAVTGQYALWMSMPMCLTLSQNPH